MYFLQVVFLLLKIIIIIVCERGLSFGVVDFQPVEMELSIGNGSSSCCRRWHRAPPYRAPPCLPLAVCSPAMEQKCVLPLLVIPTFPELCCSELIAELFIPKCCVFFFFFLMKPIVKRSASDVATSQGRS